MLTLSSMTVFHLMMAAKQWVLQNPDNFNRQMVEEAIKKAEEEINRG